MDVPTPRTPSPTEKISLRGYDKRARLHRLTDARAFQFSNKDLVSSSKFVGDRCKVPVGLI
jgi:hypothetical protein